MRIKLTAKEKAGVREMLACPTGPTFSIAAIKSIRERTGAGLIEAKRACEDYLMTLPLNTDAQIDYQSLYKVVRAIEDAKSAAFVTFRSNTSFAHRFGALLDSVMEEYYKGRRILAKER